MTMFVLETWRKISSKSNRRAYLALGAVLFLGLSLRLVNLSSQPLWRDEALSLGIAAQSPSVSDMVSYLGAVEVHPPLYYLALRSWTSVFGADEAGARSLSVVFGILTVVAAYDLAALLFRRRRAGLVAAGLVAVLPIQVLFSQEARPYTALCFFGTVAISSLWRYLEHGRKRHAVLYVVAALLGIGFHYSGFLTLFATSSWWLFAVVADPKRRSLGEFRVWLIAHGAVFLAYLPWLPFMLTKMELGKLEVFGFVRDLPKGRPDYLVTQTLNELVWLPQGTYVSKVELCSVLAAKLAVGAAAFSYVKSRAKSIASMRFGDTVRSPMVYCLFLTAAMTAAFVLSPQSMKSYVIERHLMVLSVVFAAAFGGLATSLATKKNLALVALICVTLVPPLATVVSDASVFNPFFFYRNIAGYINENHQPGDLILIGESWSRPGFNYYLRPDLEAVAMSPYSLYGIDFMKTRFRLGLVENESQARGHYLMTEERLGEKLERLFRESSPGRVWMFEFEPDEQKWAGDWFKARGWRHPFKNLGGMFSLDLYSSK